MDTDPLTKTGIRVVLQKMAKAAGVLEAMHPQHGGEAALEWAISRGYIVRNPAHQGIGSDDVALSPSGYEAIVGWYRQHKADRAGVGRIIRP